MVSGSEHSIYNDKMEEISLQKYKTQCRMVITQVFNYFSTERHIWMKQVKQNKDLLKLILRKSVEHF